MRIRSIAIATGAALIALVAMPAALLGGAMLAQSYAPDTLRVAVHAATGFAEDGLEAHEIQTVWTEVRNRMDLNVVKTATADEIGSQPGEPQPAR